MVMVNSFFHCIKELRLVFINLKRKLIRKLLFSDLAQTKRIKKKLIIFNIFVLEKEIEFLNSLCKIEPKYQLKQQTDPICLLKDDTSIKIDFKSPLIFDFSKHNDKIKPCTCSEVI